MLPGGRSFRWIGYFAYFNLFFRADICLDRYMCFFVSGIMRPTFASGEYRHQISQKKLKIDYLIVLTLFLAALLLYCLDLGRLPLRDWDEGTVAQVAKEIFQAPKNSFKWLFPTLWGQAYLNKPPLIHNLIALCYSLGGIHEWTTRLPSAIFSALSVPLVYAIGRELFYPRTPALFSALVYLTLLPVVRQGRLAMLEGAILCFETLIIWAVLRARRDFRWSLLAGLAFGLMCLTKGMLGVLLAGIALLFLAWDTPRLLLCGYLWLGFFLGSLPVFAWHLAQYFHNSEHFINTFILAQSLDRIYTSVENHQGPIWYYLLEIIKYSFPWFIFMVTGLISAWKHLNWSWGKLIIVWSGVYFAAVSIMATKLPWYITPIYPALALAAGVVLADVRQWSSDRTYPRFWSLMFLFLSVAGVAACIYFSFFGNGDRSLVLILASVAITMGLTFMLVAQRDSQFVVILFWGMYFSLLLFFSSNHWIWELNEAFPVKPVAAIIRIFAPANQVIYTSFDYERNSLSFYSDRRVLPAEDDQLKEIWSKEKAPYFLLDQQSWKELKLPSAQILGKAEPNWLLITKIKSGT